MPHDESIVIDEDSTDESGDSDDPIRLPGAFSRHRHHQDEGVARRKRTETLKRFRLVSIRGENKLQVSFLGILRAFSSRAQTNDSPVVFCHTLGRVQRVPRSMSGKDEPATCDSARADHPQCESVFAGGLRCHLDRFARASFQVRRADHIFAHLSCARNHELMRLALPLSRAGAPSLSETHRVEDVILRVRREAQVET
jgi:hypothetical protein